MLEDGDAVGEVKDMDRLPEEGPTEIQASVQEEPHITETVESQPSAGLSAASAKQVLEDGDAAGEVKDMDRQPEEG